MRIGFMLGYDINSPTQERVDFAVENGFKCCELAAEPNCGFFPGDPDWEAKAEEVVAYYKSRDIRISCLSTFYYNNMAPDLYEYGKGRVRGSILLAEKMGVPAIAGFSGRLVDKSLEESLPTFIELWSEHAKFAEDHGVKIAFENCPMGQNSVPAYGCNMMSTPQMWEMAFDAVQSDALGLEWDPSHLICMHIDPVENLRKFGKKVHHVHAKDGKINWDIMRKYGSWYGPSAEHCFPGLGDTDWGACIKELLRAGYTNDLNIEGWHDGVFVGPREDEGLIISLRHLERFVVQD